MRVVVSSLEGLEDAKQTQAECPHLTILSDEKRSLANAAQVIHEHSNPNGGDTAAPTTILIDGAGQVRWVFRPDRHITRLSIPELLAAIDGQLPKSR